jgi:hypothetical protein
MGNFVGGGRAVVGDMRVMRVSSGMACIMVGFFLLGRLKLKLKFGRLVRWCFFLFCSYCAWLGTCMWKYGPSVIV